MSVLRFIWFENSTYCQMKKPCNDTIIECAKALDYYTILAKVSERYDSVDERRSSLMTGTLSSAVIEILPIPQRNLGVGTLVAVKRQLRPTRVEIGAIRSVDSVAITLPLCSADTASGGCLLVATYLPLCRQRSMLSILMISLTLLQD